MTGSCLSPQGGAARPAHSPGYHYNRSQTAWVRRVYVHVWLSDQRVLCLTGNQILRFVFWGKKPCVRSMLCSSHAMPCVSLRDLSPNYFLCRTLWVQQKPETYLSPEKVIFLWVFMFCQSLRGPKGRCHLIEFSVLIYGLIVSWGQMFRPYV